MQARLAVLQQKWSALPGNMRGALWMLLAGVGFTGMTVSIKLAGATMPVFELIVLRAVVALAVISISPNLSRLPPSRSC